MLAHGSAASPSARRALMVWEQLVQRGIRDQRVLDAMGRLPRELFVPPRLVESAYADRALPIGHGQTISQPYMVALALEALALDDHQRVLEIGAGSGYAAALLGDLCREVVTVEVVPELAEAARKRLAELGCRNVRVVVGDGSLGYPPAAPFHRIIAAAGAPQVPETLLDQLDEGGILVLPVGDRRRQVLKRVSRRRGEFIEEDLCPCVFVPLRGEEGWGADTEADEAEEEGEDFAGPPG